MPAGVTTPVLTGVIDASVMRDARAHAAKGTGILEQRFAFAESHGFNTSNPAVWPRKKDPGVRSDERREARQLWADRVRRVVASGNNVVELQA